MSSCSLWKYLCCMYSYIYIAKYSRDVPISHFINKQITHTSESHSINIGNQSNINQL